MEGGDSIVLEEEIDPNYEPTEKEVLEYATWLGMDLEAERDLFWIAREGLKARVGVYKFYRNLYEEHKNKLLHTKDGQETDEKKKKVQEDVAELLGRKNGGKKKKGLLTKAELLGGPALRKSNAFEKKPLPGLTSRLGSVGGGGMKPVAGLGPLKSEAKDLGGFGIELDNDMDNYKSNAPFKLLSKTPLGTSISKKPQLTSSLTTAMKAGETKSNDDATFKETREKLGQDHAEILRKIRDTHSSDLEALRKKLKVQMEDFQDAEEMKLKQLKRELDKKKNTMENQFDQEENASKRNRNDKLKRLEAETEVAFRNKKEELDRDAKDKIDKTRLRHEAKQREIQEEFEQDINELRRKIKVDYGKTKDAAQLVTELQAEIELLHDKQTTLELELNTARSEKQTILGNMITAENERNTAQCEVKDLQKQLFEVNCRANLLPVSCPNCSAVEDQNALLKGECIEAHSQVDRLQKELLTLQQECHNAQSEHAELVQNCHDREATLKLETAALLDKVSYLKAELITLKSKCATFQSMADVGDQEKDLSTSERETTQQETFQKQLADAQAEAASTKAELHNLQCQHDVTITNNLQIKAQLIKETSEKKDLCMQLEIKKVEIAEFSNYQHHLKALQQQLDSELRIRQELEDTCDALRREINALEQTKQGLDAKVSQLKRDNRLHNDVQFNSTNEVGLSELENEVEIQQRDRSSLEQALSVIRAEKELLVHEKESAFSQNRLDQQEIEKLMKHIGELKAREMDKCTQCSLYEAQILSVTSERNDYHIELDNVRKELAELKRETSAKREQLTVNTANLQREMDIATTSFQDQETRASGENTGLSQKRSTFKADQTQLRAKCDLFQDENDIITKRESDISSSASVVQEQLLCLERQLEASNARTANVKSKLHDLQLDHQTLRLANAQTEEKLVKESNEYNKLCKQLDAMTEEVDRRLADATKKHQEQLFELQQQVDKECRARREQENVCDVLRKELHTVEHAKRKVDAQLDEREREKRHLESEKAMLVLRLDDPDVTQKRDGKSIVSVEESLAEKNLQVEQLRADLRLLKLDKEHFEMRVKTVAYDLEQQQTKMRRLETECEKERARSRLLENERDLALQRQQKLGDDLENSQLKLRGLSTDMSSMQSQLCMAKSNEQVAVRNEELCAQKLRQLEQQVERDELALKMKLEQAEVEYKKILRVKEEADMKIKAKEKDLALANEQTTRKESEVLAVQVRVKSLLREKEEIQAALSNATIANVAVASADRDSGKCDADVMLVKLQLADANTTELKAHLADISSQLQTSLHQCVILEARCRDQSVEIESLHVEIASLRSVSQKVHLSALESLTLVERLEYEHKKRTLRKDFMNQLRDFQQREEQALIRHKARIRAQYERQIDDVIAELEKIRHQRVEQEEALSVQMVQQIRQETDMKRNEAKRQMRAELLQLEEELHERKACDIEIISKAIEREEDELGTRLRDIRQVTREEALADQHMSQPDFNAEDKRLRKYPTLTSPGQLTNRRNRLQNEPESLDGFDGDFIANSRAQFIKSQDRRHTKRAKTYQMWKRRLQEEVDVLVNARNLVANQRQGLSKQAQQLKASKVEWKRNSRVSEANPIQREVKRMFDENMTNWSEGMRKLRKQEAWVKHRELIVAKMKRTVERLRQGHTDNNFAETSSDDDENELCGEWSDTSPTEQLVSTLDKLERLEEELASGAGKFSMEVKRKVDDDFRTVYQASPSNVFQREGLYRYPTHKYYAPTRAIRDSAGPEMRWIRSQRGFGLRDNCFELEPTTRSGTHVEQMYQQKISRWAKGREKVQHAATSHATWLSGLCEELHEYGAKYTNPIGEAKDTSDDLHFAQVKGEH